MDTITLNRKKYILVPETEYKRLMRGAPALPPSDADGNRNAIDFAEAAIARNIVARREAVGWTQKELAERAGLRAEVLNRAERGVVVPSVRTLTKIENALKKGKSI